MSQEKLSWLNQNTLIGFTDKRGKAWHYRASDQGAEPNHYAGAIPVEDVRGRLFNWEPVEGPAETTVEIGGKSVRIVDNERKIIVRPDTLEILGSFKSGYQVHGFNEWLIHNVESILDANSSDLFIGSAGLLRRGAVAWVQFELSETQEVAGVEYRPFLTAATSLDGTLATTYKRGAQVVVCDNTLSAALYGAGEQFKVKHTAKSLGQLVKARDALGIMFQTNDAIAKEIEQLTSVKISDKVWQRFLDEVAKPDPTASSRSQTMASNKRDALQGLWLKDERVSPWRGTAYGVVAALNTYDQHFSIVRGASRPERNMLNMVTGAHDVSDRETLDLLAKVAQF